MADRAERSELVASLLQIESSIERRLAFLAALTRALEPYGEQPILVGGFALEVYLGGDYRTADIDLVAVNREAIDEVLTGWGFVREGRHWWHEELGIAVEIPDSKLAGDPDRTGIVDCHGPVRVIGVEDLIEDRLNAYVHWHSRDDLGWAEALVRAQGQVDWAYLEGRASANGTDDGLRELRERLGGAAHETD